MHNEEDHMWLSCRLRAVGVVALVSVSGAVAGATLILSGEPVEAQTTEPAADLRARALVHTNSLKTVRVPDAPTFTEFVRDRQALRVLGKALFLGQQGGSGGQACAGCHFYPGAANPPAHQPKPRLSGRPPRAHPHTLP